MIKKNIPNFLTCLNLLFGMLGIYLVLGGSLYAGAYCIFAAAVMDFLDGFVARLLGVQGDMGKQLDSLADLVTFGVLPSMVMFQLISDRSDSEYLPFAAFLIGVASAWRLAKFNIDDRQSDRFIGVPTPANALLISTLPFLMDRSEWVNALLSNPKVLVGMTLLMSFLLIAELPLIALKFKDFNPRNNSFRYIIIIACLIFLIILGIAGIPFAIFFYIAASIVEALVARNASNQNHRE